MANIFIHIGQAKTGTTALQHFLGENYALLKKKGFLYPQSVMLKNMSHHPLAWILWPPPHPEFVHIDTSQDYYSKLNHEIKDSGCPNVVLSSEMFEVRRDESFLNAIRSSLTGHNIKIIVYVRRQDQAIQAHYNTNVKTYPFYPGSIQEYMEQYIQIVNSYELITQWGTIFGKDNIIVRVYEQEQMKNGIIYDFMDLINIKITDNFSFNIKNKQHSISRDTLEFLRIVNRLDISGKEHQKINLAIRSFMQSSEKNSMFKKHDLLSPEEQISFLKRYSYGNEQIAKYYLNRKDGRLFYSQSREGIAPTVEYHGIESDNIIKMFRVFCDTTPSKEDECLFQINKYIDNNKESGLYGDEIQINALKKRLYGIWRSIPRRIIKYLRALKRRITTL